MPAMVAGAEHGNDVTDHTAPMMMAKMGNEGLKAFLGSMLARSITTRNMVANISLMMALNTGTDAAVPIQGGCEERMRCIAVEDHGRFLRFHGPAYDVVGRFPAGDHAAADVVEKKGSRTPAENLGDPIGDDVLFGEAAIESQGKSNGRVYMASADGRGKIDGKSDGHGENDTGRAQVRNLRW